MGVPGKGAAWAGFQSMSARDLPGALLFVAVLCGACAVVVVI